MNNFHIPILSYVFIGVTSLVLTYATISDTENEIINEPLDVEESQGIMDSISVPSVNIPSMDETIDKVKSFTPFSSEYNTKTQEEIPTAVPVAEVSEKPKYVTTGGKQKKTKNKKPKQRQSKKRRN